MDTNENNSSAGLPPAAKRRRIGDNSAVNAHADALSLFSTSSDASESNHRPNDITPDEDSMKVDSDAPHTSDTSKHMAESSISRAAVEYQQDTASSGEADDGPTSRGLKRKAPSGDSDDMHIKKENSEQSVPPEPGSPEDPTALLFSFAATASMAAEAPASTGAASSSSAKTKQSGIKEERINWEPRRRDFYSQLRAKLNATDGCCWLTEFHFLIPISTLRTLCGLEDLSKLTSRFFLDFVELSHPDYCIAWCTRLVKNNDALLAFRRSLAASDDLSSLTSRVSKRSASRFLLDIDQSQAAKSAAINLKLSLDEEWSAGGELSAAQETSAKVPEFKVPRRVVYSEDKSAPAYLGSLESDDEEDPSQKSIAAVAKSDRDAAVSAVATLQRSSRGPNNRSGGLEELDLPPPVSTYDATAEEESEVAAQTLLRSAIAADKPPAPTQQSYTQYLGRLGPVIANNPPSSSSSGGRASEPKRSKESLRAEKRAAAQGSVAAVPLANVLAAVDPYDITNTVWREIFKIETDRQEVPFDDNFKNTFCNALSITKDREELLTIFRLLSVSSDNTLSFERLLRTIRRFGWGHEMLQKMIDVLRTGAFNFDMMFSEIQEELSPPRHTTGAFMIYFAPETADVFSVCWRSAAGAICTAKRILNNPGRGIKVDSGREELVFSSWKSFLDAAGVMTTPVVSRKRVDFHPANFRSLDRLAESDIYSPPDPLPGEIVTLDSDMQPLPAPPPAASTRRASQRRAAGAAAAAHAQQAQTPHTQHSYSGGGRNGSNGVTYGDHHFHIIESPYSQSATSAPQQRSGSSSSSTRSSSQSHAAAVAAQQQQQQQQHQHQQQQQMVAAAQMQQAMYAQMLPGQAVAMANPWQMAAMFQAQQQQQQPRGGDGTNANQSQQQQPRYAAMPAAAGQFYQMAPTAGGYAMFPQAAMMAPQFVMAAPGQPPTMVGGQHPQAVVMAQPGSGGFMPGFMPQFYQFAPAGAAPTAAGAAAKMPAQSPAAQARPGQSQSPTQASQQMRPPTALPPPPQPALVALAPVPQPTQPQQLAAIQAQPQQPPKAMGAPFLPPITTAASAAPLALPPLKPPTVPNPAAPNANPLSPPTNPATAASPSLSSSASSIAAPPPSSPAQSGPPPLALPAITSALPRPPETTESPELAAKRRALLQEIGRLLVAKQIDAQRAMKLLSAFGGPEANKSRVESSFALMQAMSADTEGWIGSVEAIMGLT
eukprot:TRINITY_DN498_c0_g2_i1.p1 TRINITY_DN498_c0_g2~~TRINITY_DN498_c0_g2_i1.p1  ORF type:complete len:1224 (-),score=302.89 TRINITY_DN498_c0_g2_i1:14-3685(-)